MQSPRLTRGIARIDRVVAWQQSPAGRELEAILAAERVKGNERSRKAYVKKTQRRQ